MTAATAGTPDVQALLATWREDGRDRRDPTGFARLEALARRMTTAHGGVRVLLEARLARLVDACASAADRPMHATHGAGGVPQASAQGALVALLGHLTAARAARDAVLSDATTALATGPALLDGVRQLCAQARTGSQLRLALDEAPEDAGPLNSGRLVHRALERMHAASPAYAECFMAYVDVLARLEGLQLPAPQGSAGTRPAPGGRRTRAKPRGRPG